MICQIPTLICIECNMTLNVDYYNIETLTIPLNSPAVEQGQGRAQEKGQGQGTEELQEYYARVFDMHKSTCSLRGEQVKVKISPAFIV